ncbi:unnamed protein product, partial [Closterium sp. NIES-54]
MIAALGFAPSTADPSLFLRTDTSLPPFYVLVYVDDLVFATADTEALTLVKSELQKRHTCTDLGELRRYLGLQITRDRARRTITLAQSHMVHQVLQRFGFRYSSPQSPPLPTGHSLSAPPSDESVEPSGPYPELVGCLMYLMTCTRPDLAYSLSLLARHVAPGRHRPEHWEASKKVLRYLCSTSGMGLVLGGRGPFVLTCHADASWIQIKSFHLFFQLMGSEVKTSVEPQLVTSWRVSWSLFLLQLAVLFFLLLDILVLRSSLLEQPLAVAAARSELAELLQPIAAAIATNDSAELQSIAAASGAIESAELQPVAAAAPAPVGPMAESPGGIDERSADRLRYPGRKRVLGFVGVQTGFGNGKRRAMLRETWFPATPEEHARVEAETGLVFRFIIGHSTSEEDEQLLQAENSTHGDFLRIDVDESYLNLNQKTLVYFTSLFKLYEAEHYVKADDDIFLMPDRLSSLIARPRESPRTYLGCFKKGYVITNPKKKWFEPQAWLLGSEYFKYASGSIYSLSYDVVKILNFLPKG